MHNDSPMLKPVPAAIMHFSLCILHLWRGGRVVYCGGLENRFGFTADGGSNPSLSANCAAVRLETIRNL